MQKPTCNNLDHAPAILYKLLAHALERHTMLTSYPESQACTNQASILLPWLSSMTFYSKGPDPEM